MRANSVELLSSDPGKVAQGACAAAAARGDDSDYSDDMSSPISEVVENSNAENTSRILINGMSSIPQFEIAFSLRNQINGSKFADIQPDITYHNRQIVVEWMYRVCKKIYLPADVLYSSVALLDRILTSFFVKKDEIQLTAITCLWIQNKMDERLRHHKLGLYVAVCQNAFPQERFLEIESKIFTFFGGQTNFQTALPILAMLLDSIRSEDYLRNAMFFLDSSLLSFKFSELPVCVPAAISILCAMQDQCPVAALSQKVGISPHMLKIEALVLLKMTLSLTAEKDCGIYVEYCSQNEDEMISLVNRGINYFSSICDQTLQ